MSPVALPRPWSHRRGRLEVLDRAECLELLDATKVGRLAFTADDELRIVPMNHATHHGAVWVTTSASSELARTGLGHTVAYEVDQVDDYLEGGWSVVIVGTIEVCEQPLEPMTFEPVPTPGPRAPTSCCCGSPSTRSPADACIRPEREVGRPLHDDDGGAVRLHTD